MNKTFLVIAAAVAAVLLLKKKGSAAVTTTDQRAALIDWVNQVTTGTERADMVSIFNLMTPAEISATYHYIFDYHLKGLKVPTVSELYGQISVISSKYNIFT